MRIIFKKNLVRYGGEPYKCFRIPGIIVTAAGTVIVYFETRLSADDWSTRGVGMLRSADGGVSWSQPRMLTQSPDVTVNNPVMIASRSGRIYFLWQEDYRRGFIQHSDDDGATFSAPVEITGQIDKFRSARGFAWDLFAFGPGHGIELRDGTLLVSVWLADGGPRSHYPTVSSVITSRDGGLCWEAGGIIGSAERGGVLVRPNECSPVELSDGSVLLNIRHNSPEKYRAVSVSSDGLRGFSEPRLDRALPDPRCFASIAHRPDAAGSGKPAIAFCNCADADARVNLTLRLSADDCASWCSPFLLEECAGYSDIVWSPDGGRVYVFYERGAADGGAPEFLTFACAEPDQSDGI